MRKMIVVERADCRPCVPGGRQMMRRFIATLAVVLFLGFSSDVYVYSVLAHEAIIGSAWDIKIRRLLLERFPNATPDALRLAHSFAYGGAVVQDLGYYAHGSHYFSDPVHYVRSGRLHPEAAP